MSSRMTPYAQDGTTSRFFPKRTSKPRQDAVQAADVTSESFPGPTQAAALGDGGAPHPYDPSVSRFFRHAPQPKTIVEDSALSDTVYEDTDAENAAALEKAQRSAIQLRERLAPFAHKTPGQRSSLHARKLDQTVSHTIEPSRPSDCIKRPSKPKSSTTPITSTATTSAPSQEIPPECPPAPLVVAEKRRRKRKSPDNEGDPVGPTGNGDGAAKPKKKRRKVAQNATSSLVKPAPEPSEGISGASLSKATVERKKSAKPTRKEATAPLPLPVEEAGNPVDTTLNAQTENQLCTCEDFEEHLNATKPRLIQERLAGDRWAFLIAVILLNKTAGKHAIPVLWDIFKLWPTPDRLRDAPLRELVTVLTPLGLQNKRAQTLKNVSRVYLEDPPDDGVLRRSRARIRVEGGPAEKYPPTAISHLPWAGRYALDSYRIFDPLLEGWGAPAREPWWKIHALVKEANEYPDPAPEPSRVEQEGIGGRPAEWKRVMPEDKELQKYMAWRWAIEGYTWDPVKGRGDFATWEYFWNLPHWTTPSPEAQGPHSGDDRD